MTGTLHDGLRKWRWHVTQFLFSLFFFSVLSQVRIQKTIAVVMVVLAFGAGSYSVAQMAGDTGYAETQPMLSQNELENLVAPIALYPDALLSQVLVASTYPREVEEAQQWLQENPYLQGRALMAAAQEQSWDPSVQALVAFPDVLARLNGDLSWTTELGNAFLGQQGDVMNAIQNLRAEARGSGRLASGPRLAVYTETEGERSAIEIQPVDGQRMAVPNYDPQAVWGAPAEGDYPALNYSQGSGFGDVFGTIANLAGFLPGFGGLLGPRSWGWALGWLTQALFVNNSFFNDFGFHNYNGGFRGSSVWVHNQNHRLGVPYGNQLLASGRGRGEGWGEGWNRFDRGTQGFSGGGQRGNFQGNNSYRNNGLERGGNWRAFNGSERGSGAQLGRTLSPGTRTDRWQSNRGSSRDSFANSREDRSRSFGGSRSFGSGYGGLVNSEGRSRESSRTLTASRGWGESSRVSAARMSSGNESSFGRRSSRGAPSRHEGSFGHGSSWKHGFSSHGSRPKAPKAPKAPHFAKSHGGGHSSGGHSGKRSHRG